MNKIVEQPANCILGHIQRIHNLLGVDSTTRRVPRTRDGALCDYSIFEGYPCSSKQDLAQPSTMSGSFCRKLLKIKQKKNMFLVTKRTRLNKCIWVESV